MHSSSESPHPLRLITVTAAGLVGLGAAACALVGVLSGTVATVLAPGPAAVDELITALSAAGSLALLLWVVLGLLVSVLSALPGSIGRHARRLREQVAPVMVRRWAGLLLGVTIASTVAPGGAVAHQVTQGPAIVAVVPASSSADEPPGPTLLAPAPTWVGDSVPAPAPDWVPTPVHAQPPVSLTAARVLPAEDAPREVVVRRGDTLWDLAAAYLPAEATDAEIAAEWQRWYSANRAVIGGDPDLIMPGQVLYVPIAGDTVVTGGSP